MKNNILLKISRILLATNAILWLIAATYFSFSSFGIDSHWLIKILLFLESVLYTVSYVGLIKKIKTIYLFSIVLTFGNTILSVTDQIDLSDIVSLILSGSTFVSLLLLWNYFIKNHTNSE